MRSRRRGAGACSPRSWLPAPGGGLSERGPCAPQEAPHPGPATRPPLTPASPLGRPPGPGSPGQRRQGRGRSQPWASEPMAGRPCAAPGFWALPRRPAEGAGERRGMCASSARVEAPRQRLRGSRHRAGRRAVRAETGTAGWCGAEPAGARSVRSLLQAHFHARAAPPLLGLPPACGGGEPSSAGEVTPAAGLPSPCPGDRPSESSCLTPLAPALLLCWAQRAVASPPAAGPPPALRARALPPDAPASCERAARGAGVSPPRPEAATSPSGQSGSAGPCTTLDDGPDDS